MSTSTYAPLPTPAATLVAGTEARLLATYPAPDGRWTARVDIYECAAVAEGEFAYEQLILTETESSAEYVVVDQLVACGGLGTRGFEGRGWSADGRYFYYTPAREGAPDGGCGYYASPIERINVDTGVTEKIGRGPLSPDGRMVAVWQNRDLVIYNLNGDELSRVEAAVNDAEIGRIVWSPDSEQLIYMQYESYCPPQGISATSIDLAASTADLLFTVDEPQIVSVSWPRPQELWLRNPAGKIFIYSFDSEMIEARP